VFSLATRLNALRDCAIIVDTVSSNVQSTPHNEWNQEGNIAVN